MKTSVRAALAGALACGVLTTAVVISRHDDSTAAPADAAPPRGPYVALGDSYTAGPGIPDQGGAPAGCDRSARNYPALVARRLSLPAADFRDVSCSGATLADLTVAQSTDHGTNPAQLSALSDRTRLVTLGMGGNDIGFASLVKTCVKSGVLSFALKSMKVDAGDAPCRARYVSDGADEIGQRIDAADEQLAQALAEVKSRAPKARVYVVGYPAILPRGAADCRAEMGLAAGDVTYLHDKEQQLNRMLRERADKAGVGYVDTYAPSVGRDACADRQVRWVEPLVPLAPAASVHPNERGEQGMADAVLKTLGV
ncbi:SGNH/GDSL hydrolase family protein [Streptomyces sp. NBC_01275]|uniref:SGNH/GDSL hydrolase family protein n=1 Tax=Streptomyces sp. NBC_01275 TaxID=2903807 RepID=UPI00224FD367|nr:SGNH/GDSL hydrolase family protein [Streptomyces sp. NBC_01275]MCX4767600.1 SGNH/GDSL hydrolase family protein [Streptomyces sp. NBC_01275]